MGVGNPTQVTCTKYLRCWRACVSIRANSKDAVSTWALVLAGGEGSRLRSLTTTRSGLAVPKQFCSLRGEFSLLEETILRSRGLVPTQRVCVVVAAQHRQWWDQPLARLDRDNVIVQPRNRGTAIGILLPLLSILERDPNARIVILPSDHHVQDEATLQRSLQSGLSAIDRDPLGIALLGVDPECPDDELGYIVPGESCGGDIYRVSRFVEKPSATAAQSLINQGGVWNVFIVLARARALLQLIDRQCPGVVDYLHRAMRRASSSDLGRDELSAVYERLPDYDFSRHVAQPAAASLRVLKVPQCGWSDLGTPRRVAEILTRPEPRRVTRTRPFGSVPSVNLAEQFARAAAVPIGADA